MMKHLLMHAFLCSMHTAKAPRVLLRPLPASPRTTLSRVHESDSEPDDDDNAMGDDAQRESKDGHSVFDDELNEADDVDDDDDDVVQPLHSLSEHKTREVAAVPMLNLTAVPNDGDHDAAESSDSEFDVTLSQLLQEAAADVAKHVQIPSSTSSSRTAKPDHKVDTARTVPAMPSTLPERPALISGKSMLECYERLCPVVSQM